MPGVFQIEVVHVNVRRGEQHLVNRIVRTAMQEMGLKWRDDYLPDHFTNRGATKYRYTPRDGERASGKKFKQSYTGQKLKKYGHTRPLEWSGDTKRQALSDRRAIAKSTSKRSHVSCPLPVGLNRKNPNTEINMREEIETVTTSEIRELEKYLGERVQAGWDESILTKEFGVRIAA